jgi:hypothetical protein
MEVFCVMIFYNLMLVVCTAALTQAKTPNETLSSHYLPFSTYHLDRTGVMDAWDITTGSPDVLVGVLDESGVDSAHVWSSSCVEIAATTRGGNYDAASDWDIRTANNDSDPWKDGGSTWVYYHGTGAVGVIGSRTNNGVGVVGIAGGWGTEPGARVTMYRFGASYWNASYGRDAVNKAIDAGCDIVCIEHDFDPVYADLVDFEIALDDAINDEDILFVMHASHSGCIGITGNLSSLTTHSKYGPELRYSSNTAAA